MASTGVEGDASPGLPVESQPDTVPDPPGQGTAMAGCTFEEARFAGFGALSGRRVLLGHLLDDLQDAVENKQNRVADLAEVDMKDREGSVLPAHFAADPGGTPEGAHYENASEEDRRRMRVREAFREWSGRPCGIRVRAGLVEEVEGLKRGIEEKKKNIMALFGD